MTAGVASAAAAGLGSRARSLYPRRRRRIRGSSIAILVFLAMCAAFVAIPLYVVIVTSFKPIERDHARPNLRAADDLDARALGQGLERDVHRARLRRHQGRASSIR